jgi:hypothetical protein
MKKHIIGSLMTLAFVAVLVAPQAHAETTTGTTAMLEQIKTLMAKLEELKTQLATVRGELNDVLKTNITEGTSSDDIKKVQELLATDGQIYPEGQVTGYFGPRTKEAIKKFQERHGLPVTGVVDEETKSLLAEYLKERQGDRVPPGLLKAPGIAKKMEDRFKLRCDNRGPGKGVGPLCERLKMHDHDEDEHDEDEDHEHDEDEDEDHDDDDTASSTDDSEVTEATLKDAQKALKDAAKAIADAAKEIRKADGDTTDADATLVDARAKVTAARKALGTRDYVLAVNNAEDAEELADEAKELAKDADEDTEDNDSEDDDEDEHDDDSEDDDDDSEDDD